MCTYSRINNMLIPRTVVDVDCDAPERRDFGGEFVEAGVVLPMDALASTHCPIHPICGEGSRRILFAFVGLRHGGGEGASGAGVWCEDARVV